MRTRSGAASGSSATSWTIADPLIAPAALTALHLVVLIAGVGGIAAWATGLVALASWFAGAWLQLRQLANTQAALAQGMTYDRVLELIDPAKDADGLHPTNLGRLVLNVNEPMTATIFLDTASRAHAAPMPPEAHQR